MRVVTLILLGVLLGSCTPYPQFTGEMGPSLPIYDLLGNEKVPNPFSPTTKFSLDVDTCTKVSIDFISISGETCARIPDTVICETTEFDLFKMISYIPMPYGYLLEAHPVKYLPSGVYFYEVNSPDHSFTKKFVLLR